MLMDSRLEELYQSLQEISFDGELGFGLSRQDPFSGLRLEDLNMRSDLVNPPLFPVNPSLNLPFSSPGGTSEGNHQEDYDFSDLVLNYINQMLMEEDEEDKIRAYQTPSALEATEKSLYEAIGEEYPSSLKLEQPSFPSAELNTNSLNMNNPFECFTPSNPTSSFHGTLEHGLGDSSHGVLDMSSNQSQSPSLNSASNYWGMMIDGRVESPVSPLKPPDMFNDAQSIIQFNKGVEEANKFLPDSKSLYIGSGRNVTTNWRRNESAGRGKKHHISDDLILEDGRGSKQSAVSEETDEKPEVFDMVLLCSGGKTEAALRESLQHGLEKNSQSAQSRGSNGIKGRGKKHGRKDVIDLRSLLTLCSQAVAANDQVGAHELLRRIRQHSSAAGDGNQRMAHYFADGLMARLAGAGKPVQTFIVTGQASAADVLRAYHLFLATCPFKKLSNFFSNRTIMGVSEKAEKVHIIDYGIVFGFQWPCLIQRLSVRPGGPPRLKITGVDYPLPGFRPAKRIEETGRRLARYAKKFNVPFEFNVVAKRWEAVTVEDLKIEEDELLIVNCMYRFKNVYDETVMVECPRNIVLNFIKRINPKVFILGVVNGAYGAPFFTTRFREALFHFSTLFDMLEAIAPRNSEERTIFEREIYGRQAMNVIACEGAERIERPETYKQWQVRNERIGLRQLPLDREIFETAKQRMKSCYDKDFVIDEDGHWMLQGWKGRIVYAISCWKPAV